MILELNTYQREALRTANNDLSDELILATASLGIFGEGGELADHIKKHLEQGHPLDREYCKKELGDLLWYVARLSRALGFSLTSIANENIAKLRSRYPNGFDMERSINRVDDD